MAEPSDGPLRCAARHDGDKGSRLVVGDEAMSMAEPRSETEFRWCESGELGTDDDGAKSEEGRSDIPDQRCDGRPESTGGAGVDARLEYSE